MALSNTTNPEQAATALGTAIARHLGASDVRVTDVEMPQASGLSNETVLFTAEWLEEGGARSERLVARVQPTGPAVFPRYDFELEFAVMQALDTQSDVPVPHMLFHEPSPELLGAPFIVMTRVDGRVASDDPPFTAGGWVLELTPEEQGRMCENGLQALAKLHAVDVDAAGLGALRDHAEAGIDGQLQFWRDTFAWAAAGDANPTVEAGFAWLEENLPADLGPTVLTWGDARIGNMLFADDLSVAAVLDWEMVAVAPGRAGRRLVAVPAAPPHRGHRRAAAARLPVARALRRPLRGADRLRGHRRALVRGVRGRAPVGADAPGRQLDDRRRPAAARRADEAEQPGEPAAGEDARAAGAGGRGAIVHREPIVAGVQHGPEGDLRQPHGDDEWWQDSAFVCFHSPSAGIGGHMRIGHEPNYEGGISALWFGLTTRDGRQYRRNLAPRLTDADLREDGFGAYDGRYAAVLDGDAVHYLAEDEGVSMSLRFEDFYARTDFFPPTAGTLVDDFASSHFECSGRVSGTIVLDGHEYEVEGLGHRDRSWGLRRWDTLLSHRWVPGTIGPELSFGCISWHGIDGSLRQFGYVVREGELTHAESVDVVVEMEADALTYRGGAIELKLPDGDSLAVACRPYGATVSEHHGVACVDAICEVEIEGRRGFCDLEVSTNPRAGSGPITTALRANLQQGPSRGQVLQSHMSRLT